jgi:anthranilate phosphoribosyltransferase
MITESIHKLIQGNNLGDPEMEKTIEAVIDGEATSAQTGSLLTALRMKGETVDEIAAVAKVLRSRIRKLNLEMDILNLDRDDINIEAETISKTSHDAATGTKTFSISTATVFVVAGGGVRVTRHTNRAINQYLGVADVLEHLNINLQLSPSDVERCVRETGIGLFFSSPTNGALKRVAVIRQEIGMRTIFNLVTPIINPTHATSHLLGVYRPEMTDKIAHVLKRLGAGRGMVVCGDETYDEISICGSTKISRLKDGDITTTVLEPEEYGFKRAPREAIRGKDAANNAAIIKRVLTGETGPRRDVVLLNAAAGFVVAGKDNDLKSGIERAVHVIDSGEAGRKLEALIRFTGSCTPFLRKAL